MSTSTVDRMARDGGDPVRTAPWPIDEAPAPAEDPDPASAFEAELARLVGGERRVVACAGGASALALALEAAGLSTGDEIGVPAIGARGVARAALEAGLRVVPVEVEQESGNVSSRGLAAAAGPGLRALAVTHVFGHPAAMPDLLRLAEHYGIPILEDVSASLGAAYSGVATGALGRLAALSSGEGHLLPTAEVGAVLVPDEETAVSVRTRLPSMGGAPDETEVRVALAALRGADASLLGRRQAAWHLAYELRGVRGVVAMPHGRRVRHGYDCYVLRLRSALWNCGLEEAVEALQAEGLPARVALEPPLHEDVDIAAGLEGDERLAPERFAIASQLARELIALPLPASTTVHEMNDLAAAVRKVAAHFAKTD